MRLNIAMLTLLLAGAPAVPGAELLLPPTQPTNPE
jgi:hypothetical protein